MSWRTPSRPLAPQTANPWQVLGEHARGLGATLRQAAMQGRAEQDRVAERAREQMRYDEALRLDKERRAEDVGMRNEERLLSATSMGFQPATMGEAAPPVNGAPTPQVVGNEGGYRQAMSPGRLLKVAGVYGSIDPMRSHAAVVENSRYTRDRADALSDDDRAFGRQKELARLQAALRPTPRETAGPQPQLIKIETGYAWADPGTRTITPTSGPDGQPVRPAATSTQLPAWAGQAVMSNQRQLGVLDDAIAKLKEHPGAVGFWRGRSDGIDQRVDPQGVPVRAAIADVGSLQIKDRSGAAVTAAEWPRMAPFIPGASDTPEAALEKLTRMRAIIAEETAGITGGQGDGIGPTVGNSAILEQQRSAWDRAAAALQRQGKPTSILGPRP